MSFGNDIGFVDTKQFRQCVLNIANERLGLILRTLDEGSGVRISNIAGILVLLDSTYKSEVPSTIYAMHLKSIAYESGRFLCSTTSVVSDLIFEETRGEFLSQNIASFLFPNRRFAQSNYTDVKLRNLYLSIIKAYFGGSTLSNITEALYDFTNVASTLIENYTTAEGGYNEPAVQFTFSVNINVDDPRIKDLSQLQTDIEFLVNIIKPAHTYYTTNFLYEENLDVFRQGCTTVKDASGYVVITHDGFETKIKQTNTSVCDVMHMDAYDYGYEDIRKYCNKLAAILVENEIIGLQASPRIGSGIIGGNWTSSSPYTFHTNYGPFGKPDGSLATYTGDITVYQNNIPVPVLEIFPLSSSFTLGFIPASGDVISVDYYFLKDYTGVLITNNINSVINNYSNQSTDISYKTVLFPTEYNPISPDPLVTSFKYKGLDFFYSSVLNCPENLEFNALGLRNKLNDSSLFKSFGYDQNQYNTSLYETTPIVPLSLDKKDVWRRLPYQEFRLNNSEFLMNVHEDRLYGEIHYESYDPFYSVLEIDTETNGGVTSLLYPVCEDSIHGMMMNITLTNDETITSLGAEFESGIFYTYPFPLASSGYTPLNDENYVLILSQATWTYPPGEIRGYFEGNISQEHMLIHDVSLETYSGAEENFGELWNRDPSENPFYHNPIPASGYEMSDRGYLFNIFRDDNPPTICPIHLDDLYREYYKDVPYFINNDLFSITNSSSGYTLYGNKVKDADTALTPIYDYYTLSGFTMNSYTIMSQQVFTIRNRAINPPLIFMSMTARILNDNLMRLSNVTKGMDYDLTGVIIVGERIIRLDNTLPINIAIGLADTDIVNADFIAIDRLDVSNEAISVVAPGGVPDMTFVTLRDITAVFEVDNKTRHGEYDLTNSEITNPTNISLDASLPINIALGLGIDDDVFSLFTTEEDERPEHLFNYPVIRGILRGYEIAPV